MRSVGRDSHQPQGMGVQRDPQLLHGGTGDPPIVSVLTCLNTKQWAFAGVDGRYTFSLVAVRKPNPRTDPRGQL